MLRRSRFFILSKAIRYLLFILVALSAANISAQRYEDDAAIWLNIYLEKKLNDKFDIHLNQKNRIANNVSEYSMGYADIGFTYNYNKNIKFLADYVYAVKLNIDGSYRNRNQFYLAVILKKRFGRLTILYRNMVQSQLEDVYVSYEGRYPVNYERNKLTVKYDLNKRFTAYAAEELYLPLYQTRIKGLDRSRTYAGLFYNLTKKSSLEVYFCLQHELNAYKATKRDFIYGLGYSLEF